MTELELAQLEHIQFEKSAAIIEAIQSQAALIATEIIYSNSLLIGYLIATYFVGSKLSRLHVTLLNLFFLIIFSQAGYQAVEKALVAHGLVNALLEVDPNAVMPPSLSLGYIAFGVATYVLIVLAALYFMWTVRHPKKE